MVTRRKMLTNILMAGAATSALAVAGCATTTNPTTGVTTYGLDPTVVAEITAAVSAVAQYAPTIESIAATAAGLFGPAYTTLVTVGSAAVNTVISALENLVTQLPVGARRARMGATPSGTLRGYVKTPNGYIPIYAQ